MKSERKRCNEICTKPITGSCKLCDTLDEADQFIRRWFFGGWLLEIAIWIYGWLLKFLAWFVPPFNDSFRLVQTLTIAIAAFTLLQDIDKRQEEREARAWQQVMEHAANNKLTIWALEYLNHERNVSLQGFDFSPPDMERVLGRRDCLDGTAFRKIDLSAGDLRSTVFLCANLQGANLQYANLESADLRYAALQDADLRHASLRHASLQDADLVRADLRNAELQGASLRYVSLRAADLRYASLRDANLRYANLVRADLRYADLRNANFRYVSLRAADLRYANLRGADLQGADLRDTKGIDCAQLQQAESWQITYRDEQLACGGDILRSPS